MNVRSAENWNITASTGDVTKVAAEIAQTRAQADATKVERRALATAQKDDGEIFRWSGFGAYARFRRGGYG